MTNDYHSGNTRSAHHVYIRVFLHLAITEFVLFSKPFVDKIYNYTLRMSRWTFSSNATPQINHDYNDLLTTWQQLALAESNKSYLQRFVKQCRNLILYIAEAVKPTVQLVGNKPECRDLIDCTHSYPLYILTRQFGATITRILQEVAGLTGVTWLTVTWYLYSPWQMDSFLICLFEAHV